MENVLKISAAAGFEVMEHSPDTFLDALIQKCKEGDRDAFAQLFSLYEKKVFKLVLRFLHNKEAAEDVLQEAFINIFRSIKNFRREAKFDTYLYRIVVNLCYKKMKSRKHEPALRGDEPDTNGGTTAAEITQQAIDSLHVRRVVSTLSHEHQVVLSLRYMEGFSVEEIAEITSISQGTVKSRLYYARMELKRRLHERHDM